MRLGCVYILTFFVNLIAFVLRALGPLQILFYITYITHTYTAFIILLMHQNMVRELNSAHKQNKKTKNDS